MNIDNSIYVDDIREVLRMKSLMDTFTDIDECDLDEVKYELDFLASLNS